MPKRLEGYHKETVPILKHYGKDTCVSVDCNRPMNVVTPDVVRAIGGPRDKIIMLFGAPGASVPQSPRCFCRLLSGRAESEPGA